MKSFSAEVRSFWLRYFHPRLGLIEITLITEDGLVKDVKYGFVNVPGVETVDLSRWIALPGMIDIHVHLRGLDLAYKEDEWSGTRAAVHGGVTAVVDMPNTVPRIDRVEVLRRKLVDLFSKSWVDFGVFIALPKDLRELYAMLSTSGVVGVKIYPEDYERFAALASRIPRDTLVVVHAEHPGLIREGCSFGTRWRCRPVEAELEALNLLREVVKSSKGLRIHVTHATNGLVVAYAKSMGFTVDTCPHYLRLTSIDEERLGCAAVVNPPLRPPEIAESLALCMSSLDALSSDHAPHSMEEKSGDVCCPGIASLDFYAPLILDLIKRGVLGLEDVVRLTNLGPQKILGVRGWGCIEPGCVASYTIVDLDGVTRVVREHVESKCRVSPYEGLELNGRVVATIVRGFIAYLEGEFLEKPLARPLPRGGDAWPS